ncbi:hypothetical protein [Streptacidiphilus albus]|uniref:hypothetical protein n=1 Tax=Streptacidiphilus albus TaxID=105425 RepID=UPI0005AA7399|nr:hypothetical protein [Streptacidiphilus albus]
MTFGPAPDTVPLHAPEERGSTRIADRVLSRIAGQAAAEALNAYTAEPERLTPPRAKAGHGRHGVSVRLGLDLPYPVDIADLTGEVHRRVVHRLEHLAGVEQPRVSLVVERLVPPATEAELR